MRDESKTDRMYTIIGKIEAGAQCVAPITILTIRGRVGEARSMRECPWCVQARKRPWAASWAHCAW